MFKNYMTQWIEEMKCLLVICFEKWIHTNNKKDDKENDETDDYAQQFWWYHGFTENNN